MNYFYHLWIIGVTCSLLSCESEIADDAENQTTGPTEETDGFFIAPRDTAGIVIPPGQMLAVFPGQREAETRAPVTGNDSRISHLQCLVYQKDNKGEYKLTEQKLIFNQTGNKSWPYKAVGLLLPNTPGLEYKYVFLGNVDKSIFSNQTEELLSNYQNNYDSARIQLPGVEFSGQNMYYLAKGSFTADEAVKGIVQRNVVLQRIVSRLDLTKQPFDTSPTDPYQTAFWKRIVSTVLWNTSREKARGGFFHYGVTDRVLRYVMALTYVATKDAQSVADQAFASPGNKYTVLKYRYGSSDNILQSQSKDKLNSITGGDYAYVNGTDFSNNILLNTAQYLYDLFREIEGGMADNDLSSSNDRLTELLNYFWGKVISIDQYEGTPFETLCINQWSSELISYVKNSTDLHYKVFFNPLRNCPANIAVIIDNMPKTIDFNNTIRSTLPAATTLAYKTKGAPDSKSDNYFSIIGFGHLASLQIRKIQFFDGTQNSLTPSIPEEKRGEIWTDGTITPTIPFAPNKLNRLTTAVSSVTIKDRTRFKPKSESGTPLNYYRGGLEGLFQYIIGTLGINVNRGGWSLTGGAGRKYTITLGNGKLCTDFWRSETTSLSSATFTVSTVTTQFKNIANACSNNNDDISYEKWTYIQMPLPVLDASNLTYSATWSISEVRQ